MGRGQAYLDEFVEIKVERKEKGWRGGRSGRRES